MLMGRRTFEVVSRMEGPWFYGETPVLVATSRPLSTEQPTVRPLSGTIEEMAAAAKAAAGEKDVYLDGGALIRSALDADLVDEVVLTVAPTILGSGRPLFAGAARRHQLSLLEVREIGGGLVQLRYRREASPAPSV